MAHPRTCLGLLALLAGSSVTATVTRAAHAETRYEATGRVVSFTSDRTAVFIAHEAIPGVMGAMTMSFTARDTSQLVGVALGDRVRIAFTVTDDGHRLLDAVRHAP